MKRPWVIDPEGKRKRRCREGAPRSIVTHHSTYAQGGDTPHGKRVVSDMTHATALEMQCAWLSAHGKHGAASDDEGEAGKSDKSLSLDNTSSQRGPTSNQVR